MGPRHRCRGSKAIVTATNRTSRFNGAATSLSRIVWQGVGYGSAIYTLQWGRDIAVADRTGHRVSRALRG